MNSAQIEALIDVVECGSFSKAAERRITTAQSVSQQVRRLEDDLGFELLERSPNGVRTTGAGQVFYEGARRVYDEMSALVTRCREMTKSGHDVVRLGSSDTYALGLFPQFVPRFLQQEPEVDVAYVSVGANPLEGLFRGDYDMLEGIRPTSPGLAFCELCRRQRVAVVAPRSKLARKSVLRAEDLHGHRLLVFSTIWAQNLQAWLDARAPGMVLEESPFAENDLTLQLVEAQDAIYFIPEQLAVHTTPFVSVPLETPVSTEYGLVYLRSQQRRLEPLLRCAREVFADDGKPAM